MHVCFHQLCHNIDVFIASGGWWFQHIDQVDDILLVEEFEELDFSNDTLGVNKVFKSLWDLLDRHFRPSLMIVSTADNTISTMADLLDVLILRIDIESGTGTNKGIFGFRSSFLRPFRLLLA